MMRAVAATSIRLQRKRLLSSTTTTTRGFLAAAPVIPSSEQSTGRDVLLSRKVQGVVDYSASSRRGWYVPTKRSITITSSATENQHQIRLQPMERIKYHPPSSRFFSTATAVSTATEDTVSSTATSLSSATTPPPPTTKKGSSGSGRRSIVPKDPIIVTENAAARIGELLQGSNAQEMGAIGLRLGVKRRGCNGLSYTLNYVTQQSMKENTKDTVVQVPYNNITVYIEPMALFNVVGTVMDYVETDMGSEFTFENPNSKGSCGCGESFNV